MQDDAFDDALTEDVQIIIVGTISVHAAGRLIGSCEHCRPDEAEIPFDWLLAEVTGKPGPYEFVLSEPARCPNCKQPVLEKTLIEPKGT